MRKKMKKEPNLSSFVWTKPILFFSACSQSQRLSIMVRAQVESSVLRSGPQLSPIQKANVRKTNKTPGAPMKPKSSFSKTTMPSCLEAETDSTASPVVVRKCLGALFEQEERCSLFYFCPTNHHHESLFFCIDLFFSLSPLLNSFSILNNGRS
mmetsp:Transcript_40259/g.104395  ORF Transcript_40259/g.104395 Transcript_40259/m.104395 type:complete len:153 (+) Transcript_40259:702-1160(+)